MRFSIICLWPLTEIKNGSKEFWIQIPAKQVQVQVQVQQNSIRENTINKTKTHTLNISNICLSRHIFIKQSMPSYMYKRPLHQNQFITIYNHYAHKAFSSVENFKGEREGDCYNFLSK